MSDDKIDIGRATAEGVHLFCALKNAGYDMGAFPQLAAMCKIAGLNQKTATVLGQVHLRDFRMVRP